MSLKIQRILCPADFSVSAEYALDYALSIAVQYGARIELLHVTEPSAYAEDAVNDRGQTVDDTIREHLHAIAEEKNTPSVNMDVRVVDGIDYLEIVHRANAWPADLIVMGTHGRTGMKHLLIGSVAERVVRTAPCPVLTTRHPNHVLPIEGMKK